MVGPCACTSTVRDNSASVCDHSDLVAGDGGYSGDEAGITALKGSLITRHAAAAHTFTTGTLTSEEVANHAIQRGNAIAMTGRISKQTKDPKNRDTTRKGRMRPSTRWRVAMVLSTRPSVRTTAAPTARLTAASPARKFKSSSLVSAMEKWPPSASEGGRSPEIQRRDASAPSPHLRCRQGRTRLFKHSDVSRGRPCPDPPSYRDESLQIATMPPIPSRLRCCIAWTIDCRIVEGVRQEGKLRALPHSGYGRYPRTWDYPPIQAATFWNVKLGAAMQCASAEAEP